MGFMDLDGDKLMSRDDWDYYKAAMDSDNGMLAIRLGGSGDMTAKSVRWKTHRGIPQLPSPLIYENVLYMVNDNGGIVTMLDPDKGDNCCRDACPAGVTISMRPRSPATARFSSRAKKERCSCCPPVRSSSRSPSTTLATTSTLRPLWSTGVFICAR